MDDKSTTDAADNQDDQLKTDTQPDSKATTDQNTDKGDDLDTSKSTDTSADDDKSKADGDDDTPAKKFDTDLDEWASRTGRAKPETDRERELYQEIRDGQRDYSRSKQAKDVSKDVDKAIRDAKPADNKQDDDDDDRDPVEKRQDKLEAALAEERSIRARSEYFTDKSVTTEESKIMGQILKEKVDKGGKAAFDYWTSPDQLEDWHALAKARLASTRDTSVIEQEAARKERERIEKESQATGASRSATSTTVKKDGGYNRTEYLKSDD